MLLGPPLPATILRLALGDVTELHPVRPAFAQESFHVISGIYPLADTCVEAPFVEFQNVDCMLAWSKSVPPIATLNGVDARPLTAMPPAADVAEFGSSHPADPLSPAETTTVIPCAAACCQSAL